MKEILALVNGYGIPENPLTDGNYQKYLSEVQSDVEKRNTVVKLFLAGGAIGASWQTEAGVMKQWFKAHPSTTTENLSLINKTIDVRENLHCFLQQIYLSQKTLSKIEIHVYCEETRCTTVKFLAKRLANKYNLPESIVHGIAFDARSLKANKFGIGKLKYLNTVLGWYIPYLYRLQHKLRQRKIKKCRSQHILKRKELAWIKMT